MEPASGREWRLLDEELAQDRNYFYMEDNSGITIERQYCPHAPGAIPIRPRTNIQHNRPGLLLFSVTSRAIPSPLPTIKIADKQMDKLLFAHRTCRWS